MQRSCAPSTREAYRAGAKRVTVRYGDQHVRRAAIELGPEAMLGQSPQFLLDATARWRDERPAVIHLTGDADAELLSDLDPRLVARSEPTDLRAVYVPLVSERLINWVIVAAPNEGWAQTVFGEPDLERLWGAVATATRLDTEDPVAAWREHDANLKRRAATLNGHGFDAVRFRGPGTDLTVGLLSASRWMCAAFTTADGIEHIPNLPTEEVFTSPDLRRSEGTVRSTYPLAVGGTTVRDLELRFEHGRVVDVRASQGADVVRGQLEADEQAAFLGEVALVDGSSAVKKTGLVFSNTLFDENATCHIAYGTRPAHGRRRHRRAHARRAARDGRQRLADAHGLHDRRTRGRGRRARPRRSRHADHARRRLRALSRRQALTPR